jgi:hypothetical protein
MNQDTLRVDLYKDIASAVANGTTLADVDQRTILPSSFISGPRAMRTNYHDAMAIVRSRGRPDYFITMTTRSTININIVFREMLCRDMNNG